jgi:predicted dehydrogenase
MDIRGIITRLLRNMIKLYQSIKNFLGQLSTKPHYESYTWGAHRSIFAQLFYQFVYLSRFLSPLQWYKTIWRELNKSRSASDGKERKDFHALHSEYYLLVVMFLSLSVYFFNGIVHSYVLNHHSQLYGLISTLKMIVLVWLVIESILWILYYMLLRILIEKRLSIFNEAEYFIVLPAVLFTQIVLFTGIFNVQLSDISSALFNLPYASSELSSDARMVIGLLGYIYTVLIIANIINLIPALPVRKRPNITIIGAGDVVEKRILPALMEQNFYRANQLSVASDTISKDFKEFLKISGIKYFEAIKSKSSEPLTFSTRNKIREDITNFVAKRSSYAIIATPTEEHFPYMTALAKKQVAFAIEKPIVGNRAELEAIKTYGQDIMSNGFLLSYYWLEKALPLNYFLTLNANYRDFLDISTGDGSSKFVSQNTLAYIQQRLGSPESVTIVFYEQEESRVWALLKETGGFYYETFIHPITLLYHTLGNEFDSSMFSVDWYTTENAQEYFPEQKHELGANFIHLRNTEGLCKIDIKAGKFTGQKKRCMTIKYASGCIEVDLDEMTCDIKWFCGGENAFTKICIKPEYKQPYASQMRLYDLFINESGKWTGQRFDDFPSQYKVLEEMLDILKVETHDNSFFEPKLLTTTAMRELIAGVDDDIG